MTAPTSPVTQQRNAEMTALASADLLSADDKNCATEVYDSAGLVNVQLSVVATIPLNTQIITSFPEVFSLASNKLTILEYGLYHFYGMVGTQQAGGSSQATNQAWIEEEYAPGTWLVLPMSQSYATIAAIPAARATNIFSFVRFSQPNYSYRIRVMQAFGSSFCTTIPEQCRLGCIRLFKMG